MTQTFLVPYYFAFCKLIGLKNYTAIFDEFFPDEANTLKQYIDISGASVEIIGKTQNINAKVPRVVSCIIKPTNIFNC